MGKSRGGGGCRKHERVQGTATIKSHTSVLGGETIMRWVRARLVVNCECVCLVVEEGGGYRYTTPPQAPADARERTFSAGANQGKKCSTRRMDAVMLLVLPTTHRCRFATASARARASACLHHTTDKCTHPHAARQQCAQGLQRTAHRAYESAMCARVCVWGGGGTHEQPCDVEPAGQEREADLTLALPGS
jgi:hypothetical protein